MIYIIIGLVIVAGIIVISSVRTTSNNSIQKPVPPVGTLAPEPEPEVYTEKIQLYKISMDFDNSPIEVLNVQRINTNNDFVNLVTRDSVHSFKKSLIKTIHKTKTETKARR